jgi:DNA repair exonuclease SbcCD ATPase subunit
MMRSSLIVVAVLVGFASAMDMAVNEKALSKAQAKGSAVQKVIELLEDMKGKVKADLAKESDMMEEYLVFCSDETKEKGYAIQTATRTIEDLKATIEQSTSIITEKEDEIATLGTHISEKEKELDEATAVRKAANDDFVAAEKELVKSVGECERAAEALAKGLSLMQVRGKLRVPKKIKREIAALKLTVSALIGAAGIDAESTRKLKSFIQQTEAQADSSNDDLSLHQPQAKQVAYESKSGAIVDMIKEMKEKVEGELSALRKKEMGEAHEFKMLEQNLVNEITHSKEALSAATSAKSGAEEASSKAEGDLVATEKTKAADEAYAEEIKTECETKATEWEARQKSAKEELGALDKAKSILAEGVKALVQVQSSRRAGKSLTLNFDDMDAVSDARQRISKKLRSMGMKFHSFALMQLASVASSDPFVKIRGLIEEMIATLLKEAEEEATQKAFCDEEIGKSKKSKADKTSKIDKYQARIDKSSTAIEELNLSIKELEAEVAAIDKAQSEATAVRTAESTDNLKAMKDFKDSADAVIAAIGVLKSFYDGGALIQTSSKSKAHSKQPEFGAAKSDAGGSIISVLEVAESDFTTLYAETETAEQQAADAYEKLTTDNKVSKATKFAEVKGKKSEVKSLTTTLEQAKEDHASTSAELDAVLAYLDKLKPQCESKAMSYEEKVAKRNAEIEGLKEALSILESV